MPISSLASALVKASLLSQEIAVQVERRRELYGGGIDTVLLEMDLLDEGILVTHLANFTGIPAAPLERLAKPDLDAGPWLDAGAAARLGAVPSAGARTRLELAVHPEATTMPWWRGPASATCWWNISGHRGSLSRSSGRGVPHPCAAAIRLPVGEAHGPDADPSLAGPGSAFSRGRGRAHRSAPIDEVETLIEPHVWAIKPRVGRPGVP